ncbi:MAG: cyclic nucleotide-binding domain-containing protein [Alphaproteobacteria bacterium]|nr:cyclic nucleotide-binding domain-containing protein [Alphaproteobacteria bacterium]
MHKLRKVAVATGLFWVEAPEAGVFVQCGAPADSVKHLMKRGLIVPHERNGVSFESGPNMVLLSDVLIQNGAFCNLTEFPVLQMLYRQGMILPGHPGNRGTRPVLIGRSDQLSAQLDYIHRGNYGLVSEDELISVGVEPELAAEFMRIKLKFAFGRIRPPDQLVGTVALDGFEPTEIRNGVTVRRLALNRFEFAYGGETAEVDLSLGPDQSYEAPYPRNAHAIRRDYFSVIHSGDGDGWDTERPAMGAVLTWQGRIYLVDAGPNIQSTLTALGIGLAEIEGIFQTHCHDDHFCGLATILRADRRVKFYATPMVRLSVVKKLSALVRIHEDRLNEYLDYHDLALGEWNDVEGLEVKPLFSPHPVETNLFVFRALWSGGFRTYAHFADLASLAILRGMRTDDPTQPGISARRLERVAADYLTPVDVKKIDIGGGLVHGCYSDFVGDRSGRLILAHNDRPLTHAEKAVGSGATFGAVDVLIPASQNYAWRYAFEMLNEYFPGLPGHQLRILMNAPLVSFNPETILIREGQVSESIYLLLTGSVEVISTQFGVRNLVSSGALLGELTGLHGLPAMETCRTASFVEALVFPSDIYLEFVVRNDLFAGISQVLEYREFLQGTRLCGEITTTTTLNRIALAMRRITLHAGDMIGDELGDSLCFLRNGTVERLHDGAVIETMGPGDFFGEDGAVFWTTYGHRLRVAAETDLYAITPAAFEDIPGVRWKMLETFQRRRSLG